MILLIGSCGLFESDEEDDLCSGTYELNYAAYDDGTLAASYRDCFNRIEASQLPAPQDKNWVDILFVRDGNPSGFFSIRLDGRSGDFFDAPLDGVDAYFYRLDANKQVLAGTNTITGFEMLKIDKSTRQISFRIEAMNSRTSNVRVFTYEPLELTDLTIE